MTEQSPDAFDAAVKRTLNAVTPKPIGGPKRNHTCTEERKRERNEKRIATRIAHAMPQEVKRYFVKKYNSDAEDAFRRLLLGSDHVCEKCECHRPNHQTVRLFFEMAGAVGAPTQVMIGILQRFGLREESELGALVESGRRLHELTQESGSLETMRSDALAVLQHCIRVEPQSREAILGALGGAVGHNGAGDGSQVEGEPDRPPRGNGAHS